MTSNTPPDSSESLDYYENVSDTTSNNEPCNSYLSIVCQKVGHDKNPMNIVCVDENCKRKGLICQLCQHYDHKQHAALPLKIFLEKYRFTLQTLGFKQEEYLENLKKLQVNQLSIQTQLSNFEQ